MFVKLIIYFIAFALCGLRKVRFVCFKSACIRALRAPLSYRPRGRSECRRRTDKQCPPSLRYPRRTLRRPSCTFPYTLRARAYSLFWTARGNRARQSQRGSSLYSRTGFRKGAVFFKSYPCFYVLIFRRSFYGINVLI